MINAVAGFLIAWNGVMLLVSVLTGDGPMMALSAICLAVGIAMVDGQ